MLSLVCLLALVALIGALAHAYGKAPLWISVVLLAMALLVGCLPIR